MVQTNYYIYPPTEYMTIMFSNMMLQCKRPALLSFFVGVGVKMHQSLCLYVMS